jgi:RimJ/RimL family protein N-acetyltransferase
MEPIHLFDSYYFHEATQEEFSTYFTRNRPEIFGGDLSIDIEEWLSDEEKQKRKELGSFAKERYYARYFILNGDEIIGWHLGWQIDAEQFYMGNTGLYKAYQGKRIYTALLPKLLEIFKEKGFQKITSRHRTSNNAVLVPKLKAGFVITGFEIEERFGLMVTLAYIFNEKRLKAYQFRTGALRPDDDLKKYL